MPTSRSARLSAAAVAITALSIAAPTGRQPSLGEARRLLVNDVALPGIDRGLASADLPWDPVDRSRRGRGFATAAGTHRALYQPGSIIVKFKESAGSAQPAAVGAVGGRTMTRPTWADFDIVALPAGVDPERAAADLAARPEVEYAQARYRNHAMYRPNDPFYSLQWNWPALDMERAWDINPGATSDVVVAVLDGGVAYRNALVRYQVDPFVLDEGGPVFPGLGLIDVPFAAAPDLGDASRFVAPHDFIWDDDLPLDLDGHGTHVAGTIGQSTNNNLGVAGMAFNVKIMPVKVIAELWDDIFASPFFGTDDVVARGIRYAADNGAHVINMSIGRDEGPAAPVIEAAVRYAVSRGVFVAIAAGNDGNGQNRPNRSAEFATSIDGAVAVGAVGRTLNRAYYSTTGAFVELSAPGGDQRLSGAEGGILQQMGDQDLMTTYQLGPALFRAPRFDAFRFYYLQGTSMATPHVSGFAALLRQQGLTTPAAIEAAMKQFATDRGAIGRDDEYGAGLVNPRATLRGLGLAR
jgi:serine protease